jgi:hypothetical protein
MSDQSNETDNPKEFVVVMRGPSAALFKPDEALSVRDIQSAIGPVNIVYTTRHLSRSPDVTVPGQLWIDIRGNAPTLDEALEPFANAAFTLLPILTLSANAAIGDLDVELGFDNTADITERDYFQNYIPLERDIPHPGRIMDVPATVALLKAFGAHPYSERLLRGANQYSIALQSWRLGQETLSLAHLWMATEAITKVRVRDECEARGVTEPDLAVALGIEREQYRGDRLEQAVRRDLLLKGDSEAYSKAREASDGFEHGYMNYSKIRELSRDVRHRMARYVRTAILEMCGLDNPIFNKLKNDPFDKPLGHWPIIRYLQGKLVGSGEVLAAPGNTYPFIKWNSSFKSAKWEGGKYNIEISENLIPQLAEGIRFQGRSIEAWQAE